MRGTCAAIRAQCLCLNGFPIRVPTESGSLICRPDASPGPSVGISGIGAAIAAQTLRSSICRCTILTGTVDAIVPTPIPATTKSETRLFVRASGPELHYVGVDPLAWPRLDAGNMPAGLVRDRCPDDVSSTGRVDPGLGTCGPLSPRERSRGSDCLNAVPTHSRPRCDRTGPRTWDSTRAGGDLARSSRAVACNSTVRGRSGA